MIAVKMQVKNQGRIVAVALVDYKTLAGMEYIKPVQMELPFVSPGAFDSPLNEELSTMTVTVKRYATGFIFERDSADVPLEGILVVTQNPNQPGATLLREAAASGLSVYIVA